MWKWGRKSFSLIFFNFLFFENFSWFKLICNLSNCHIHVDSNYIKLLTLKLSTSRLLGIWMELPNEGGINYKLKSWRVAGFYWGKRIQLLLTYFFESLKSCSWVAWLGLWYSKVVWYTQFYDILRLWYSKVVWYTQFCDILRLWYQKSYLANGFATFWY